MCHRKGSALLSAYSETAIELEENSREDDRWPERVPGKSAMNCGSGYILCPYSLRELSALSGMF